jgi:hypothetical protein
MLNEVKFYPSHITFYILDNFLSYKLIYCTIYYTIKVEKKFTDERLRDRSGNPFFEERKKDLPLPAGRL